MRILAYLWASPNTCLGLLFVPFTLLSGGRMRLVEGVLEVHGGFTRYFLRRLLFVKASAMTLGHVVLGLDCEALDRTRKHEHVHVRQCERWGLLFLPAYFLSSFLVWRRGGNYYMENRFEKEAYAIAP